MEVTALCFRLLMLEFILLGTQVQDSYTQKSDADFPRIIPNRLQHFQYDNVFFDCVGFDGSSQPSLIKNTQESGGECVMKRTSTGFSCTIERAYTGHSGEYWCETSGGQRSNRVNITVTDGSVILESPVLPVLVGHDVILNCSDETTSSSPRADFHKDGDAILKHSSGQMTIKHVSKSHEGFYKCNISGVGESPESWLAVTETKFVHCQDSKTENDTMSTILPSTHEDNTFSDLQGPKALEAPHELFLLLVAVITLMLVLVLLIVGFLHFRKCRVPADDVADDPNDVTYADVVIKKRKDEDSADTAENLSPRLEKNHSRKPQKEEDEDESFQPVYSALTLNEAPQAAQPAEPGLSTSTVNLNHAAATDTNTTEPEVLYSPIVKATKSGDT